MIPKPNKIEATVPVFLGPNFSTNFPINAADVPKQKIAKLNAKEIDDLSHPVISLIGSLNTLHAYAEPIDR